MLIPSTPLHLRLENDAQAFALALAGFALLEIRHEYSPPQLEKLALTARAAWQQGVRGTVSYTFERTEGIDEAAAAFLDESAKIKAGSDGTTLPHAMPADVVRIAAALLIQRKPFADLWKKVTPMLTVQHAGEKSTTQLGGGAFREVYPGFTSISIDASPEDLARLDRR